MNETLLSALLTAAVALFVGVSSVAASVTGIIYVNRNLKKQQEFQSNQGTISLLRNRAAKVASLLSRMYRSAKKSHTRLSIAEKETDPNKRELLATELLRLHEKYMEDKDEVEHALEEIKLILYPNTEMNSISKEINHTCIKFIDASSNMSELLRVRAILLKSTHDLIAKLSK